MTGMNTTNAWITRGFESFRKGTFGNGGQNIYVSRAGVLQRIFRYDFRNTGDFDLLFVNSQDMDERPPVTVYDDPLGKARRTALPTRGAYAAAVGDLNGDGIDEIVIGNQCDGSMSDLTAFVYYGSAGGWSERFLLELPAPNCRGVAIGDFAGSGRPALAFACNGRVRLFQQDPEGFIPSRFSELDLDAVHMVAADLDGDGFADLYVRPRSGPPRILWGGPGGLDPGRATPVGSGRDAPAEKSGTTPNWAPFILSWRPKILTLDGTPHVFCRDGSDARLYPVQPDRTLGAPRVFPGVRAAAAAAGDIDGDGHDDLVLVVYAEAGDPPADGSLYPSRGVTSWIYWGGPDGFDPQHRTPLATMAARDVVVADLDGDGRAEILICQGSTAERHTVDSVIFKGCAADGHPEPARIEGHDPTAVLLAHDGAGRPPKVVLVNHVGGRVRGDVPLYLYTGGADGYSPERRVELPGWSAPDAVVADFDDDGWADLFVSNCAENAPHLDPGSFLYRGGPDGFHPDRKQVFPTFRAHGSAAGDFRRCGSLDLAVAGFSNPELRIFRQRPDGFDLERFDRVLLDPGLTDYTPSRTCVWDDPSRGNEYRQPRWLFAADFNRDGWLDLFVSQIAGPRCLILWGGPEGFSLKRCQWLNAEGSACAQAADLSGNGWLDLVIGGHQSLANGNPYDSCVTIYWGGPEGYREDRRTQLPIHGCNSLTIADFNRDGILDIFATSYKNGRVRDLDSFIYWGAPGGVYSVTNRKRLFSHSASGCLAGDFNGDGWVDLAVACHKTYGNHVGRSQVWWNGPEGFSEKRRTLLPTLGPHGMIAVDPGNILDRGPEEYYDSSPYPMPAGGAFDAIHWESAEPPKTWVRARIRTAASPEDLGNAPWSGPRGPGGWYANGERPEGAFIAGKWIQYRLALGSAAGANSPRVISVTVSFRPLAAGKRHG